MSLFKADLHCHTTCSDGSFSPEQVVDLALSLGLQAISITDHDTIAAYNTVLPYAHKKKLRMGTGVEFSCSFNGLSVHVLGYDFLPSKPEIQELCSQHQKRRQERNRKILNLLEKHQMPIDEEELGSDKTIGRPHIAAAMVKKGYVSSITAAFQKYLGEGKLCYDPGQLFSVEETIEIIHQSEGKAFIAHPHLLPKELPLEQLLKLPFDGIECYYSRFPYPSCAPFLEIAKKYNLLISGGSDFHGAFKPDLPLGASFVDKLTFDAIFTHGI